MSFGKALLSFAGKAGIEPYVGIVLDMFPRLRCATDDHEPGRDVSLPAGKGEVEFLKICKRCRCLYDPEKA